MNPPETFTYRGDPPETFTYRGGNPGRQNRMRNYISTVEIDPSIASIEDAAFYDWRFLRIITIPPSVTSIGTSAFYCCTSLTAITLPPSLDTIGSGAFYRCRSLVTITIPRSVKSIEARAFCSCTSLVSVRFETDPSSIDLSAFEECPRLTTVHAPSFSTTALDADPSALRNALVRAGYSLLDLRKIRRHEPPPVRPPDDEYGPVYYHAREEARKRGEDGRLPLYHAAVDSLGWAEVGTVFGSYMPASHEVDGTTGLAVFMSAAVGEESDFESVYGLLRSYPPAIVSCVERTRDGR